VALQVAKVDILLRVHQDNILGSNSTKRIPAPIDLDLLKARLVIRKANMVSSQEATLRKADNMVVPILPWKLRIAKFFRMSYERRIYTECSLRRN
jgi:hypothetical protein